MGGNRPAARLKIGVLAVQGAFREHVTTLEQLGAEAVEVRLPPDLEGLDGLILPGGESTTMGKLMQAYGLNEPVTSLAAAGKAVWGTCAGMIMLAQDIDQSEQARLGLLRVRVNRNAFGRQVDSFEQDVQVAGWDDRPFHAIFIRAPVVTSVDPQVTVLARLDDDRIVAVQQDNLLATAFHPELTADTRFHEHFLRLARQPAAATPAATSSD